MNQWLKVRKLRRTHSTVAHSFTKEFMDELKKCNFIIQADFFGIWKEHNERKYNIYIKIELPSNSYINGKMIEDNSERLEPSNDEYDYDSEIILEQYNQWINRVDVISFKSHSNIVDGLIRVGDFTDPMELLEIMKILYKGLENSI